MSTAKHVESSGASETSSLRQKADMRAGNTPESDTKVTRREIDILEMASQGLTDKEIAIELELSLGTVRTYWNRLRAKSGAQTRAQAVGQYMRWLSSKSGVAPFNNELNLVCSSLNLGNFPVWAAKVATEEWKLISGGSQPGGQRIVERLLTHNAAWHSNLPNQDSLIVTRAVRACLNNQVSVQTRLSVLGDRFALLILPLARNRHDYLATVALIASPRTGEPQLDLD